MCSSDLIANVQQQAEALADTNRSIDLEATIVKSMNMMDGVLGDLALSVVGLQQGINALVNAAIQKLQNPGPCPI